MRATEREADLKDRVRLLEERLVLLTEPSDAKLTTGPILDEESPGAATARCITSLVEVLQQLRIRILI